ncbi:MAG TPA: methionine--tRNA ligase [Gammaproteobacteria bacterium]|nr:methionine--tRNA ligase [Gammaproteobacteria bacterium]
MTRPRRILVTSALPYANGPIHLGHLVEYVQTDIWVRFQKMRGHECWYVCADDAHGTPIMLKAEQEGVAPEELIARVWQQHTADFAAFGIGFDNYHTTHSAENRAISSLIYTRLRDAGYTRVRAIRQAYDPVKGMFLPDRFIKGTCPRCKTPDQYGDSCEHCGATYAPTDLIDAVSALTGVPPEQRESEHVFFKLGDFEDVLRGWLTRHDLQPGVVNKLEEWFAAGLQDWDISRDAPYFGFEIPGFAHKYFYVWLDAPIGYFASFRHLCDRIGLDFDAFVGPDSTAEMYHFIGKDIMYFHTLFWPAMLQGAGFRLPTNVFVHGFLTVDGQKMSKSRGTFVTARTYLDHLNPEYLRYYFAAKLGPAIDDIDLNLEDFQLRVNADLVGKVVNIASRCAGFVSKQFGGRVAADDDEPALLARVRGESEAIAAAYEARDYARAMREIMALADLVNQYVDRRKPWVLAKDPAASEALARVCATGLRAFRLLMIYLKPVLPALVAAAERFLRSAPLSWAAVDERWGDAGIEPYQPLLTRIDPAKVQAMIDSTKAAAEAASAPASGAPAAAPVAADTISIDDFARIDLRIARVIDAQPVEGADKLVRLELDLGDSRRQVFAGIKAAYAPSALIGRLVVCVANLAPRKMRFGVSEGMVLAASGEGPGIFLLDADDGAAPGMRVK